MCLLWGYGHCAACAIGKCSRAPCREWSAAKEILCVQFLYDHRLHGCWLALVGGAAQDPGEGYDNCVYYCQRCWFASSLLVGAIHYSELSPQYADLEENYS